MKRKTAAVLAVAAVAVLAVPIAMALKKKK